MVWIVLDMTKKGCRLIHEFFIYLIEYRCLLSVQEVIKTKSYPTVFYCVCYTYSFVCNTGCLTHQHLYFI